MKKVKNKNVGDTVTDDGYIDKTEVLEKGIRISPSIFLEGAAASGKSTAVKMLIGKHPEVSIFSINMEEITVYIPFQVNHLHGQTEPVPRRMRATLTETEPVLFDVNYQTTVC